MRILFKAIFLIIFICVAGVIVSKYLPKEKYYEMSSPEVEEEMSIGGMDKELFVLETVPKNYIIVNNITIVMPSGRKILIPANTILEVRE